MTLTDPDAEPGNDPLRTLLDRYLLSGDDHAMEEIVAKTRGRLLAVARRIGKPHDAEDAVQTAYFSLIRKRGERLEAPVLPWLLTAVVRIAYRQKAVHARQHELVRRLSRPARTDSPLPEIANAEQVAMVRREIARLPAKYRDPIVLRLLQGLTTAETAALLDLPEATVRTHLHRGRLLLRSRWPAPVAYGALLLPWCFADTGRSLFGLFTGGAVPIPAVVATVVTAGLLGTTGGLVLRSGPPAPAYELSTLEDRAETLWSRRATLTSEVEEKGAEREALAARRDAALAALRAYESGSAERTYEVPVGVGEFTGILSIVNWEVLGENVVELTRLLERYAAAIQRAGEIPAEWEREKNRRNGILLREAAKVWDRLKLDARSLPHAHPVFLVNAMAAGLSYRGLPLTGSQKEEMTRRLGTYLEEDAKRRSRYTDETWERVRLREETELSESALADVRSILTADQRDALFPSELMGRVGLDLYSPGLVWASLMAVKRIDFADRDHLVERLTTVLRDSMPFAEEEVAGLRRIAAAWVDGLPDEVFAAPESELDRAGLIHLTELHAAARRTEALLHRIGRELPANKERTLDFKYGTGVILPIRGSKEK